MLGDSEYNVDSIVGEKTISIKPMSNCNGTTHVFLLPIFLQNLQMNIKKTRENTQNQQSGPKTSSKSRVDYILQMLLADYRICVVFEE